MRGVARSSGLLPSPNFVSSALPGAKFREPIVNHQQVTQLWNMFDKLGSYILSGEKNPKDAQAWAIGEYKNINDNS